MTFILNFVLVEKNEKNCLREPYRHYFITKLEFGTNDVLYDHVTVALTIFRKSPFVSPIRRKDIPKLLNENMYHFSLISRSQMNIWDKSILKPTFHHFSSSLQMVLASWTCIRYDIYDLFLRINVTVILRNNPLMFCFSTVIQLLREDGGWQHHWSERRIK